MEGQHVSVSRELGSVEPVLSSPGNCQVTTKVQAPAPFSTTIATGTMFSVTAKQNIEILSFEFAHFPFTADLEVEIYVINGKDYVANRNTPSAWTKLSQTTSVDSPDAGDDDINIAPRADMTQAVVMNAAESKSFYFTLRSQHLKLEPSSTGKPLATGQVYFSDNFLSTDVGIGVRVGGFPNTPDDSNRGFQGRIHYRVIQSCSELLGQTQSVVKAVVPSSAVPQSADAVFLTAFTDHLNTRVDWKRWTETEGLRLNAVSATVADTKTDCSEHGVTGGCTVYDSKLTMVHYASLAGKEVELEVIRSIVESNNTVTFSGTSTMTYIGPRVLSRYYRLQLVGTPKGAILNPIQRDYIATVTMDFLSSFSETVPNTVEVISQDFSRRMIELRGSGRQLQDVGVVTAEAYIYGLGDDPQAFYEPIESAFKTNEAEYRTHLQREQYRPSAINDGDDFGAAFKDVLRISVNTNETVVDTATASSGDDTDSTAVVIWSLLIAASVIFLIYRCVKDFLMEQDGHRIKKESVSEHRRKQAEAEEGGQQKPTNYLYGARDGDKANGKKKNPNGKGGPPGNGKKKKRPQGGPNSKQSINSDSGHSGGQRPNRPPGAGPPPNRGRPGSGPQQNRRPGASPPQKPRKKPVKKKRPPNNAE